MAKKPKMLRKEPRSPKCREHGSEAQNAEKMAKKPKMIRRWLRSPKCGENG